MITEQEQNIDFESTLDRLFAPSAFFDKNEIEACFLHYGYVSVLQALAQKYPRLNSAALDYFYRKLQTPKYNRCGQIKTIAMLYNNMRLGGTERVMSLQMKMFTDMGLRIVLLNDTPSGDKEYKIPNSVRRIMIPPLDARAERVRALVEILKQESVDLLYIHAPQSYFFDILSCRLGVGIPCICHFHFNFSFN